MSGARKLFDQRVVHLAFEASLLLKGLFALCEIVGGVLAYFVTQKFLLNLVQAATQGELSEDPRDLIANYLLHQAEHLSVSAQHFAALYLLSHGVVKLALIVGLLEKKLWCYPTAIVVFGFFVVYQVFRYTFTHSLLLLLITGLDLVVIGLTWHEYQYLRRLAT